MEQLKHIPQTLKFMLISIALGISAMIMAFLTALVDTRIETRWLTNIMFAVFVFSNIFTILAISSYYDERKIQAENQ